MGTTSRGVLRGLRLIFCVGAGLAVGVGEEEGVAVGTCSVGITAEGVEGFASSVPRTSLSGFSVEVSEDLVFWRVPK